MKLLLRPLFPLLAALLFSASVHAGTIQIEQASTRATIPGQDAAGVDLTITSPQPAELAGVSSPAAAAVEMHSMVEQQGMMRMHEVHSITLPAGKRFNLHAAGYHLMLVGLKAPLKEGATLPLTLQIKTGKQLLKLDVQATVKPMH